jgi:Mg2+ and Co2+ transporter CorA
MNILDAGAEGRKGPAIDDITEVPPSTLADMLDRVDELLDELRDKIKTDTSEADMQQLEQLEKKVRGTSKHQDVAVHHAE